MRLTIDAGNTRTKWAVFDHDGNIANQGACLNEAMATADLSPQALHYERAVISNVAGRQHAALLKDKLALHCTTIRWVTASAYACNVFNSYTEPETLGSDRWAALIAAWHMQHAPCVVVNAGTAVTIDALTCQAGDKQQGRFLGGMILPGLDLMQISLGLATAQLPKNDAGPDSGADFATETFAKNTREAINAGALNAISGAIARMASTLTQECKEEPCIILSGGNAFTIKNIVADSVTNPVIIVDNLVLQGLYLLDRASH